MKSVLLLAVLMALPTAAEASPRRIALFVGSNAAPSERDELRYAEADAERLRDVMVELGEVRQTDAVVLDSPSPQELLRAIDDLAERVGQIPEAFFVFYYSGHADDRALLLGDQELRLTELRTRLASIPAGLQLHIVDACRSGALTRSKGAKLGSRFSLRGDPLGEGKMVITSSAEWEDSQESDRLGGSFFTLHLATGLRGAADANGDARISIQEAYAYVYGRTIESTISTTAGPQHPAFRYDVRGHGDIVLTELIQGQTASLRLAPKGEYLIVDGRTQHIVAEIVTGAEPRAIALRPGRYRVSRRTRDALLQGWVDVPEAQEVAADNHLDREIRHARLVRKGGAHAPSLAHRISAEGGVRGPLSAGIKAAPLFRLSYGIALSFATVAPRFSITGGTSLSTPRLQFGVREVGLGVEFSRAIDLDFVTVAGGLFLDVLWLTQRESNSLESARSTVGSAAGLALRLERALPYNLLLGVQGELGVYNYSLTESDNVVAEEASLATIPSFRLLAGVGYEF